MRHHWICRGLPVLSYGAFLLLVGRGAFYLTKWAVNVPYLDEWEVLRNPQLPTGLNWHWLWAQHNEHRILLTNLEVLVLYHLTGWNLIVQQLVNYAFYVGAVILLGAYGHRCVPSVPRWAWAAFLLFFLSPRLGETMLWGFQSQWHFAWAFAAGASMAIFTRRPTVRRSLLGAACAALAVVSLAGGLVIVLFIAGVYVVYRGLGALDAPADWPLEARDLLLFLVPCALVLGLWAHGYRSPSETWPFTLPWSPGFWSYYLNLVSAGFGIDAISMPFGALCVALVVTPLVGLLLVDGRRLDGAFWGAAALGVSVLGVLGTITMARAAHQDAPNWLKGARYAEFAQLLLPVAVLGWALLLDSRPVARRAALLALWLFCFLAFRDNWSYRRYYKWEHERRTRGLMCAQAYYEGHGGPLCRDLYPWDLKEQFDNAKVLNVSFYRKLGGT